MFDVQNRFVIENYQNQPPFSSFLPGIAGETGIPVWCYYNNRGQAVCSFGVRDKDHAIMEFSPAHVAYRDVSRTGFRTFCKSNGDFFELFTDNACMHIGMSELEITCTQKGLSASAVYFGVPEERTGALARILTVTNSGDYAVNLELVDGMPAVVPYGLNQDFLKNMTQLSKAWMQAEDYGAGQTYFRVRASLEDSAVVRQVTGGNFCLGWDRNGNLLRPIVQPSLIFGEDTSLACPRQFLTQPLETITGRTQVTSNQFLCCFLPVCETLAPGASVTIYSIYGQTEGKERLRKLADRIDPAVWFPAKRKRAAELVSRITAPVFCQTGSPVFDAYTRQTYLDNALRGGAPMIFRDGAKIAPFHIYSRKHGDPEREYNYFSLGTEYYAQGNGNYRDVNQNRRCDVLFAPETGADSIYSFFDLIQTDGYNPLVILPVTYTMSETQQHAFGTDHPWLSPILSGHFTPGQIAMAAEDAGLDRDGIRSITGKVICASERESNADFGEGYWCDHWTYNLDLIETYLSVFPDRKEMLLFTENTCKWYDTPVLVNPRSKRYAMTENGLRQYHALNEKAKCKTHKWMRTADAQLARSSLIEKILLLCAIKTATLDAAGMGVEMEGGRPGWYDALNGLPGLFGSSMAETCELARLLHFAADALDQRERQIPLYCEINEMLHSVHGILTAGNDPFLRWNAMNAYKERYRADTLHGFHGSRVVISGREIAGLLRCMESFVLEGITRAKAMNGGLIPTYFTFRATKTCDHLPTELIPSALPLFLEGPVRYLKLALSQDEKNEVFDRVQNSGLYDRKLHMYKVNESLNGVSYEAGRALAFTPGWLENESIWLHMEYKYLLELLKNGLYKEFSVAFRDAAIPFQDPRVYGRSTLENVSFIASSANPDESIHGRGFVARLSGSTAEFIHIWQILFFGKNPFRFAGGKLTLAFEPMIPSYLMPDNGALHATFLGRIPVTYHTGTLQQLCPGVTEVAQYILAYRDGHTETIPGSTLPEPQAIAVRSGDIIDIQIEMQA